MLLRSAVVGTFYSGGMNRGTRRQATMIAISAAVTLMVGCAGLSAAFAQQVNWPSSQSLQQPGESTSVRKASLSPGAITAPGAEVAPAIRGLSGRWTGWMCPNKTCAAALEVGSLNATGGQLRMVVTTDSYYDFFPLDNDLTPLVIQATLQNGNELAGKWKGLSVKVRLRPDGNVDILRWDENGKSIAGVLSRAQ